MVIIGHLSEITKGLDDRVEFWTRPLQAEHPFIWVDALYEKIKYNNRVMCPAIMITHGVDLKGYREVLAWSRCGGRVRTPGGSL